MWDDNEDHSGWPLHKLFGSVDYARVISKFISKTEKEPIMDRSEEMIEMRKFVRQGGMAAIAKRIIETGATSLTEPEFTTLVQQAASLSKVSFEKAFTDPDTMQAYKIVREAGYVKSLNNLNVARMTPTSTSAGSSSVSDDSAEAVRQLTAMAEEQHRTFEEVILDPANKVLALRTYTSAHKPNISTTPGD
jgi:hypothetical protein